MGKSVQIENGYKRKNKMGLQVQIENAYKSPK